MNLQQILELLSRERPEGDEMTGAFLEDAVAAFATNPAAATATIRKLQGEDPCGSALAAVQLLASATEKSPGVQFVASLILMDNLLITPLLDPRLLGLEAAVLLARNLATADPLLDVRMARRLIEASGGQVTAIEAKAAQRALHLMQEISNCARLTPYLIQLLRHPHANVRSKVVLLLGKANLNVKRAKGLLSSDDPRVRANVIESLWRDADNEVVNVFTAALKDGNTRVVVNSLVGLCLHRDRDAQAHLLKLGVSPQSAERAAAAWAMGALGFPQFEAELVRLVNDEEERIRALANKSLAQLQRAGGGQNKMPKIAISDEQAAPEPVTAAEPVLAHVSE